MLFYLSCIIHIYIPFTSISYLFHESIYLLISYTCNSDCKLVCPFPIGYFML